MSGPPRASLGLAGEGYARRFLEAKGYTFIAANWRCRQGELDLVMRDSACLVFVEVKTRHGERAGRAEETISPAKAQRIFAAAEAFLAEHPELADLVWRVDLLAITLDRRGAVQRITHAIDALVTG
ncbi:MAG TPA: YraN family protein [Thermomicrobiales bacterium]